MPSVSAPPTPNSGHPTHKTDTLPPPPPSPNQTNSLTTQREQTLKQVLRSRPTEGGEIEGLRNAIREAYVRLLFQDPTYAASKDMDQSLWKTCFYRKIEEFRKEIRKYAAAASNAESKAMAHKARAELHAVCAAFGEFIAEALTFYQDLMGRYELLQAAQREEGREEAGAGALEEHCVKSIHRCLIFLGDLARYRELHSESTRKDWSQAEKWYYQAIDAMPTSGNPHNQLAVLATYTEAECVAVYRYCRALLCANPFPTAKENLSLLFEKNKQSMPDRNTDDGADEEEEEERVRQGLAAGTITGQQAGIARATMLKSLLQRFVRLHGMLFSYRQQQSEPTGGQEGPFPVGEFMNTLHTAMLDLRQLLKMSAFGDGLLLHMVAICVFSVLTSLEESSSSSSEEEEDSSVQALSLSLAFGVVAEIAACVRTARQESEHTTAKPPGSRLLGPVVVFCDWIWSRPGFGRLKPLGSSGVAGGPCLPEKEMEAAIREQFWRGLCKVASELQVQLLPGGEGVGAAAGVPEALVWVPQDGRVLKEQHDLRGFEPLEGVYGKALMTRPKAELGRLEIVSDDLAATWRTMRLVRFLREVGVKSGVVAMTANPVVAGCWIFQVKGRENVLAPAFAAQAGTAGHYYNGGGMNQAFGGGGVFGRGGGVGGGMGGGREEEVVVFKPSFASPSGAGAALNGAQLFYLQQRQQQMMMLQQQQYQQQQQQQQHQHLPSLDDSSQLPKEMVESMLGGLLDCSDSGPHPNYLGSGRAPQGSGVQASGFPGGINTAGHVHPPFGSGTDSPRSNNGSQQQQQQQLQQQQQQQQQQPASTPARFGEASSLDGGASGAVGWNAFRPTGASMTPPPPGLAGSSAAALILGRGSYGLSMFADSGAESEDDMAGLGGLGSPLSLPPQMGYKPFGGGGGLLGMGGTGAGQTGRHSAPPGGLLLTTRNPFLTSAFGFAP